VSSHEAGGSAALALTAEDLRGQRVRAQRLHAGRPPASVASVVHDVFALQAQDDTAVTLGIWTRSDGLTIADVTRARERDRSVVRLWCLRGTLHLIAAEDVRWLLDLLRPVFVNANRTRRAELGLDDDATTRSVRAVVDMLGTEGCLTRGEIADRLAGLGIASAGQATVHVIWRAALDGLVCYGPDRHGEAAFVRLDDWVPPAPGRDRDDSLAELARRYLQAYGPATPQDLAVWSGLSLTESRRAWSHLGNQAVPVPTVAGSMWLSSAQTEWWFGDHHPPDLVMRLLPAFDGLWLGYRDRDILLPPEYRRRVYPGGGVIRPSVLLDGQAAGTWTRRTHAQSMDLVLDFFDDRGAQVHAELREVAADLGRFLGQSVRLAGA
jgi:Winged helix DNA-binding domain